MSKLDRARRRTRAAREIMPLWMKNMIMLDGFEIRDAGIGMYWIVAVFSNGQRRDIVNVSWSMTFGDIEIALQTARTQKCWYVESGMELNKV